MTKSLLLASFAALALACAPADETEDYELEQSSQELTLNLGSGLSTGARSKEVGITGAENSLLTSTNRLLVTGDKGIYEITKDSTGKLVATQKQAAQGCQFGGLTETRNTVYANCYGAYFATQSFVYAAPVGTLAFSKISTLNGRGLANGLGSDSTGNLYVATTAQDQIVRLAKTGENPLVLAPFSLFLNKSGAATNGLKYYNGSVYWTDLGVVKSVPVINGVGSGENVQTVAKYYNKYVPADTTVFDDLTVDSDGLLVCDFVRGLVRAFAFDGSQYSTTPNAFNGPSSVTRLRGWGGFSARALLVTERNANKAVVFEPGS